MHCNRSFSIFHLAIGVNTYIGDPPAELKCSFYVSLTARR